jgi:NAD(P)-dependent dehydrogenase (short-subunit alcohol dehydrogenase family)
MAHVLGEKQIRVNTIAPGLIKFPGGAWQQAYDMDPEKVMSIRDKVALGKGEEKWGTAEQVADVTVFLASPRASYVSGTTIVVDGAFRSGITF